MLHRKYIEIAPGRMVIRTFLLDFEYSNSNHFFLCRDYLASKGRPYFIDYLIGDILFTETLDNDFCTNINDNKYYRQERPGRLIY